MALYFELTKTHSFRQFFLPILATGNRHKICLCCAIQDSNI